LLVNIGTRATGSQQGGFAMITVLLAVGFVGLLFLRKGNRDLTS
jgi:UMF1 family MFS transporter